MVFSETLLTMCTYAVQILGLHLIPGTIKAADLTDGGEVETLAGMKLTVGIADLSLIHI